MLPSCIRATVQKFAEFAQNIDICTPKLEKSSIFTSYMFFSYVL